MRLIAAVLTVTTACTPWPKPTTVTSPELARATVQTIDILPLDLEVWTHPEYGKAADAVRAEAEVAIASTITRAIHQRGYQPAALIDWRGTFTPMPGAAEVAALAPEQVVATTDSLASYGAAVHTPAGVPALTRELPFPFLPHRLGEHTGSDATLYVGGWGFAGKSSNAGNTIAVVLAAVLIIGVVIAIAAAVDDKGSKSRSKSRSSGRSHGSGGRGGSDAATRALSHLAISVGRVAAKAAVKTTRFALENPELVIDVVDAFGRQRTHRDLVEGGRPEYAADPQLPRNGGAAMYLEMTLVDNRTGVALWHARQRFPGNPDRRGDVTKAVESMVAQLPRALHSAVSHNASSSR